MTPLHDDRPAVSPFRLFSAVLRHRRMILGTVAFFTAVAVGWGLVQPREYEAAARFVPEAREATGADAATLARQFGINLGRQGTGYSSWFYADLLESRETLASILTAQYRPTDADTDITLSELWKIDDPAKGVGRLRRAMRVHVDRQTGVVSVSVRTRDPALSRQIIERIVAAMHQFNVEVRRSQAQAEVEFVQDRLGEAQASLRVAEDSLQAFLRQNRQFDQSFELRFEHDRLQREVALRQEMASTMYRSLEQARIDAVRDTPVLTVIAAGEMIRPVRRFLVMRFIVGATLGLALGVLLALTLYYLKDLRGRYQTDYQEFEQLRAEALRSVPMPGRGRRMQPQ